MRSARLKELGEIITGNTPKTSEIQNYESDDICFVKPSDIDDKSISKLKNSEYYISEYARKSARIAPKHSILVTCIGTIGKIAILENECAFNQQINAIIPDEKQVYPLYLAYNMFFQKKYLQQKANAPVVPIINKTDFGDFKIKLHNLIEQQKIIDVLDKIENLIDNRQQQLNLLDELIKSRFIEMFGDPVINPMGWKIINLSQIAEYFNGLTYSPDNIVDDGMIVLRSSNIQNGELDFNDIVRVNVKVKQNILVKDDDILMCSRNGSARLVGKAALIRDLKEPMTFGAFMMIIRSQYNKYLMQYLKLPAFRRQIKTAATTTINQITIKMLDDIKLPLPPIELQNKFAAFVEQVEKTKSTIKKSLEELNLLKDSLMQKYFD